MYGVRSSSELGLLPSRFPCRFPIARHATGRKNEKGLRTLMAAKVEISEKRYKRWLKVFREAEASVQDREAKVGAAETSSRMCVGE